jgi:hypothetical protein
MATARFVIKKKYLKSNGTTPIYLQYIFNSDEKTLINTGLEVKPEHWNPVTQSVRDKAENIYEKSYSTVNAELYNLMSDFKNFLASTINRNIIPSIKFIKDHFDQYLKLKNNKSLKVPEKLVNLYDHIEIIFY